MKAAKRQYFQLGRPQGHLNQTDILDRPRGPFNQTDIYGHEDILTTINSQLK
jgi:hypothetical protein